MLGGQPLPPLSTYCCRRQISLRPQVRHDIDRGRPWPRGQAGAGGGVGAGAGGGGGGGRGGSYPTSRTCSSEAYPAKKF